MTADELEAEKEEIRKANEEGRIGFSDNDDDKEMEEERDVDDNLRAIMSCSVVRGKYTLRSF
jgi:hypothetical protein